MKRFISIIVMILIFATALNSCGWVNNNVVTSSVSRTTDQTNQSTQTTEKITTNDVPATTTEKVTSTEPVITTEQTNQGTQTTENTTTNDVPTTTTEKVASTEPVTTTDAITSETNTPEPPTTESHTHSYTKTVIPPTMTVKGYTIFQCTCGESYEGDYVSQLAPSENSKFIADFLDLADKDDYFAYFVSEDGNMSSLKELTKAVYGADCEGWGGTGNGIALESERLPSHFILRDDNVNGELTFSAKSGKLRVVAFKAPVSGRYSYGVNFRLWNDDNKDEISVIVYRQNELDKELNNVGLNKSVQLVDGSVYLNEGEYLYVAITADKGVWNYGAVSSFCVTLDKYATVYDGFYSWFGSSYEKVSPDVVQMSDINLGSYKLYMGKNEKEGFQISLRSEKIKVYTVKLISTLPSGVTCNINKVYKTVKVDGERWADPIVPLTNGLIKLNANDTASIYIEFETSSTVKSGKYTFTFAIMEGNETVLTYEVELTIWNFTYSETPTFKTTIGLNKYAIALEAGYISNYYDKIPDEYEEEVMELYLAYYEYMLDNRISPTELPYDILDPRADKYMSDPRLTSFSVPTRYKTETRVWGEYISDETLKAYYAKLSSNPEWLKKAYIYPVDEPTSKAHLNEIIGQLERYKTYAPDLKVATSFFMNFSYGNGKDAVDILTENLSMLSIKTCTFNGDDTKYGIAPVNGKTLADRMKEYVRNGGEMWSYICWEPGEPYANMYVNEPGINHRLSMWQQYDVGAVGFLYWDCTYWECVDNPWENMATVPWVSSTGISPVHGDGSLLYPGHRVGVYGGCGSVRFFAVRDGVEDVMLLKMAEDEFGRDWVDAMIDRITTSMTEFTSDSDLFDAVRIEIGNAVSNSNS